VGTAVVVAVLGVLALWILPSVLTRSPSAGLGVAERLKAANDVRVALIQGLGALGLLGGLLFTARTFRLNQSGQMTDRYAKAVEQLGNDTSDTVRIGGIYALERVMRDSLSDGPTILEVLTAFIRNRAPFEEDVSRGRPDADVQAALTVVGRSHPGARPPVLDLRSVDLRGAEMGFGRWPRTLFTGAHLEGAQLVGADLERAFLDDACLRDTNVSHARLDRASLSHSDLTGAHLEYSTMTESDLYFARLCGVQLASTDLTGASLRGADLSGALMHGTSLTGATLYEDCLTEEQLAQAFGVESIVWEEPAPDLREQPSP
jgi:pentapeptide repeat protein